MICRGMGVWVATPERKQTFCYGPFRTHPSHVFKMTFSDPWCAGVWMFGAPPQNPNSSCWLSPFQTHLSQVLQNTFSGPGCVGVWVFGAPPQSRNNHFAMVRFKHIYPRYSKTAFLVHGVLWYGCVGRHPRTQTIFWLLSVSNTAIPGIRKCLFRPMVLRGMGVWVAIPEPKQ